VNTRWQRAHKHNALSSAVRVAENPRRMMCAHCNRSVDPQYWQRPANRISFACAHVASPFHDPFRPYNWPRAGNRHGGVPSGHGIFRVGFFFTGTRTPGFAGARGNSVDRNAVFRFGIGERFTCWP
jgi:hypothetical protein